MFKIYKLWKYFGNFDKLYVSGIMWFYCLNKLKSFFGVRYKKELKEYIYLLF